MKQIDSYPHKPKTVKPDVRQTQSAGGNFTDRLKAYRDQHAQSFFSSLGRLFSTPFTSTMTIGVLALAIALASGFYLVVVNLQQLTTGLEASNQISLFLRDEISEAHANKYADNIRKKPNIQHVKVITKKQAMAEFKDFSGFGDAIEVLEKNPLPIVIEVLPKDALVDKEALTQLFEDFKQSAEVDFAQMDMAWVERLQSIVSTARLSAILLAILLGLAVFFIAGNTIRLEIHNRRQEIIIAKLVGATNGFIQRPFLYTGFWIGFLSGVAGWFIATSMLLILRQSVENLSGLYKGAFHLMFFSYSETFFLLTLSTTLAVVGSWIVLHFQIKQLQPE
ncbi:cell division protein FtsX [Methyloglobulus morosus KoM1]|uniref:Cell division protein FtsX n=1 Tax=Methyloglobulus morosus KoM1 TaxID=1116472 RepID=V5C0J8_9GAMM|nr:permease-like cell division protein FtsX [Methyloglobulus morosus]ESS73599.1 cell division protein FtsX [Methyloglobulus morosus KoM1]